MKLNNYSLKFIKFVIIVLVFLGFTAKSFSMENNDTPRQMLWMKVFSELNEINNLNKDLNKKLTSLVESLKQESKNLNLNINAFVDELKAFNEFSMACSEEQKSADTQLKQIIASLLCTLVISGSNEMKKISSDDMEEINRVMNLISNSIKMHESSLDGSNWYVPFANFVLKKLEIQIDTLKLNPSPSKHLGEFYD
jgi:septal ring factor EnvC (AmiA/AmiB activator)